jgi:6-carboxyhexanoate--CoA ligase
MLYSVRMRSAEGGPHEMGGRHISGAERIVTRERVEEISNAMLQRAFSHTRGQADFINIVVEKIEEEQIQGVPLLPITMVVAADVVEGHKALLAALQEGGVTLQAAQRGIESLLALPDSMRGAMLFCNSTGQRLDDTYARGIRVSRMDIDEEADFIQMLGEKGINNTHVREALVLASKVAAAPGMVAELCWSDDPEYTTGYVAFPGRYIRIPHCKPMGSAIGGRVFFIKPETTLSMIKEYLEQQAVLVTLAEKG